MDPLSTQLSRARTGDRTAIEALLVAYLPGLRDYLSRHAGAAVAAKETPDDLAQSVCREVLERLDDERLEYRGEAQFRQWLYQAAVHKLQNRRRHLHAERRDTRREVAASGTWEDHLARLSTPSQQAMRREDLQCLEGALAALTDEQREIIRLARLEGRSHAAIAAQLGVTESHSRVLLARAMARLGRLAQLAASR
ncbi:MAG: sigma-70 family RNA polymerase sigma factor [Planctomycetes bacterium]|nr:sigma-70 family RNA polymerase sigma factor [Planctomycetota bacterium]